LQLRRAVLGGDAAGLVAAIRGDGLDPAARLRIYRNHAFATLGAVLESTSRSSAASSTNVSLRTPRMNTCANTRRIRVSSSSTVPTLPVS
jgi:hypothetical protein